VRRLLAPRRHRPRTRPARPAGRAAAQIVARLEVERSRITTEATLQEARIRPGAGVATARGGRRKTLELPSRRAPSPSPRLPRPSRTPRRSRDRPSKAVSAEEKVFSARETEIAQRTQGNRSDRRGAGCRTRCIRVKVAAKPTSRRRRTAPTPGVSTRGRGRSRQDPLARRPVAIRVSRPRGLV